MMKKILTLVMVLVMLAMTTATANANTCKDILELDFDSFMSRITISETIIVDDVYYKYIYMNDIFGYVIELKWVHNEYPSTTVRIYRGEVEASNETGREKMGGIMLRTINVEKVFEELKRLGIINDIYEQNKLQMKFESGQISKQQFEDLMFMHQVRCWN